MFISVPFMITVFVIDRKAQGAFRQRQKAEHEKLGVKVVDQAYEIKLASERHQEMIETISSMKAENTVVRV